MCVGEFSAPRHSKTKCRCTFFSTWDLNRSGIDPLLSGIGKQLRIHLDEAKLEADATSSGALAEHLGNLCRVLDVAAEDFNCKSYA